MGAYEEQAALQFAEENSKGLLARDYETMLRFRDVLLKCDHNGKETLMRATGITIYDINAMVKKHNRAVNGKFDTPFGCPFCGSRNVVHQDEKHEFKHRIEHYIYCYGCDARGPYTHDEATAWGLWNVRSTSEGEHDVG